MGRRIGCRCGLDHCTMRLFIDVDSPSASLTVSAPDKAETHEALIILDANALVELIAEARNALHALATGGPVQW